MFYLFYMFISALAFAEPNPDLEKVDATMIVEAHSDLELYVAPINIRNEAPEIEAIIGENSVFGYISNYKNLAKIQNGSGGYEPISMNTDGFKVYNEDTISYVWEDCNYRLDHKKCTFENQHYLLETYITVDRHQLVVEMFLYDPDLQIVSRSSQTSNLRITWIKQQEETTTSTRWNDPATQQGNCSGDSCTVPSRNDRLYNSTITSKPKEELPLRWDVPHKLLDSHVQQAAMKLWLGVKIDLY